ncbi:hypothetical protein ACJMK2_025897 [Sinanodonta woodiana]|uniref:Tubulin-specific chaperone cofactor E-like protein n=1 Tax=Sinanodonta woodiana TaxID=1069815 RepID=A0ABD3XJS4_SINWO
METRTESFDGHTLMSAVLEKYDSDPATHSFQIFVPKSAPGKTDSGELVLPSTLALDKCGICYAGNEKEIATHCSHVTELDLTGNSIRDWQEVFRIVEQMPQLKFLNLTSNNLQDSTFPIDYSGRFPKITDLVLNSTFVAWDIIDKVLKLFPKLVELHLSLNNYATVDLPSDCQQNSLTRLFLNENKFREWQEIIKLGQAFHSLENMVMINVNIESIVVDGPHCDVFSKLVALNISKTNLGSWEEIDKLDLFPSLQDVRLWDIPFLEEVSEKERRQFIIARLPKLTRLNGSEVTKAEREDAERAFIRHYINIEEKPKRYSELEAIHGKLDPLVKVNLEPQTLFNIKVKFEDKEEMMMVDSRNTVTEFKKVLQIFTGLPMNKFRLYHMETFHGQYRDTTELRSSNRQLFSFNIRDGDEFHIDRKC